MKYWNAQAREYYDQLFSNINVCDDTVMAYVRERLKYAIAKRSPEMVCAILRYCDENSDESAKVRFSAAIRSMSLKLYDVAYACWDDDGNSFLYVDDDPDMPEGIESARILRDLCASMQELQMKLHKQTEATIDGELCELLNRGSADIVGNRKHPDGLDPIICYADLSCLYADPNSATGYSSCDELGNCRSVMVCAQDKVFSKNEQNCVTVDGPCGESVNHELYTYDETGACSGSGTCETDWIWNGERCGYALNGDVCDTVENRVWKYDIQGECVQTQDCTEGVFSYQDDTCVFPNTTCSDPQDHRLMKYDQSGACVAANECETEWEFVADSCQWSKRQRPCDPTPEEIAIDDKRVFEYDVMGSCLPTNRCVEGWNFNGTGCTYGLSGTECTRQNHRIHRYDDRQRCVPQECETGWNLSGDNCVFDKKDEECKRENNQIFRWNGSGECSETGVCVSENYVYRNNQCVDTPRGCPSGFSLNGEECYRSFGTGGEGSRSLSFSADPSYQIRAQYDFRKEPRYNDGDYTISSNFGLSGGQGGIRGSHSLSSGWMSGQGQYSFNARQNDGSGTLHVWLRPG